jgi:signal transduction histidine kinase
VPPFTSASSKTTSVVGSSEKTGHGFGLHISALSAAELKGRLTCSSSGLGQGATFTLEFPLER